MKKSLVAGLIVGYVAGMVNVLHILKDYRLDSRYRTPMTKFKDYLVEKLDYLLFAYHRHGQQPEYRPYTYQQMVYTPPRYNHYRAYNHETGMNCGTCRYGTDVWDSEHCDGCCDNDCHWEPIVTKDRHSCLSCKWFNALKNNLCYRDCVNGDKWEPWTTSKTEEEAEET